MTFLCDYVTLISSGNQIKKLDLIGFYLNSVVVSIVFIPIAFSLLNLYFRINDPIFLSLRSVSIFSPVAKLIIRVVALPLLILHCSIMNFGTIIILSNVALMFLDKLAIPKPSSNLEKQGRYLDRYRELQIIAVILNHGYYHVMPVGLGCAFLCSVSTSYMVIKFVSLIPLVSLIPAATIVLCLVGMSHFGLALLVDIEKSSAEYVRYWSSEKGYNPHWGRKLRSYRRIRFTHVGNEIRG